jgi:very-short-patch-repair endonuclease
MKRYPPLAGAGGGQLRLIIEVDGYSHFLGEVMLKDKIKEEACYEVIRFTDTQVLKKFEM